MHNLTKFNLLRMRRGSILEDELKESGITYLPSPLCGKGPQDQKLYNRLRVTLNAKTLPKGWTYL